MFKLAEINPCQKHACPRPAGGAGLALGLTAALHGALIAALAAIHLAQPSKPALGQSELQAVFAHEPDSASDWREPAALAVALRSQPRLAAAREIQTRGLSPSPGEITIPQPPALPALPTGIPQEFAGAFIADEEPSEADAESEPSTPPPHPRDPAKKSDDTDRPPRETGPRKVSAKFVSARVRSTAHPQYPTSDKRRGHEGVARIRLSLDTAGKVIGATVSSSSGHASLDAAALKAAARWKFAPATRGERPVASVIIVPIRFSMR